MGTKVAQARKVKYVLDGKEICLVTVTESGKLMSYHQKRDHKVVNCLGVEINVITPNGDTGGIEMAKKIVAEAEVKVTEETPEVAEKVTAKPKATKKVAVKNVVSKERKEEIAKMADESLAAEKKGDKARAAAAMRQGAANAKLIVARKNKERAAARKAKVAELKAQAKEIAEVLDAEPEPGTKEVVVKKAPVKKTKAARQAAMKEELDKVAAKPKAKKVAVKKEKGDSKPSQWFYDLAEKYGAEVVERSNKVVIKIVDGKRNWLSYIVKDGERCFVLDKKDRERVVASDPKAEKLVAAYMAKTK